MSFIPVLPIPADTVQSVLSSFGNDHPYIQIGNRLPELFSGKWMEHLILVDQRLAQSFWPYAPATIIQFWEHLPDSYMIIALHTRTELQYALHLPLHYPGIHTELLCDFRQRILRNQIAKAALQEVAEHMASMTGRGNSLKVGAGSILFALCNMKKLEILIETISNALEMLAASHADLLRSFAQSHWYERYSRKAGLAVFPRDLQKTHDLLDAIGQDCQHLMTSIKNSGDTQLMNMPEIKTLHRQWQHHYQQHLNICPWACPLTNNAASIVLSDAK